MQQTTEIKFYLANVDKGMHYMKGTVLKLACIESRKDLNFEWFGS
jgi:hypothetical protein